MTSIFRIGFALLIISTSFLVGCSRGPVLTPVTGRLTLNDKPCVGVAVNLSPDDPRAQAFVGSTDADGNFTMINAFGKTGIAPGEYTVSISIPVDAPGGSLVPQKLVARNTPWRVKITGEPNQVLSLDMSKDSLDR